MKKNYIQSIGTFAIALPLLAALILTGIISLVKGSLLGDFAQDQSTYLTEQSQIPVVEKLRRENAAKRSQLEQWNQLMTGDSFSKVNEQLRLSITNNNKTKTLQLTDQKRAASPTYTVDAARSACAFEVEGTFTELQRCVTELECTLPNLMVNKMTLTPQSSGNLLNLQLNYTIWEKAQ